MRCCINKTVSISPFELPIYDMLTDEARIAKACHLVCEASRNDRQLAVFWRRWCWKGAFLTSFED